MATYRQFFTDVLAGLGIPATDANLNALASVSILEGLNNRYNPLNSVVPMGTSTPFNSVGVQDYKNYNQGVAGTIKLLQGSHWSNVVSTLRTGNDAQIRSAFKQAYTWDPNVQFNASESQTQTLLDTSLGSGPKTPSSGNEYVDPSPPIAISSLHAPLSDLQRTTLTKYIKSKGLATDRDIINEVANFNNINMKDVSKLSKTQYDTALINIYVMVVKGARYHDAKGPEISRPFDPSNIIPWADSLAKMLSWLTTLHNWQRIGLFTLGAIILLFAAFTMFGNSEIGKVIPTA